MIDIFTQWHMYFFDAHRVPVAVAAIIVTIVIGMISGPFIGSGNANPFTWLVYDKLLGGLGDRMNKTRRARGDLIFRGFLLVMLGLAIAVILGKALDYLIKSNSYGGFIEGAALSLTLTSGATWYALLRLYTAMEGENIQNGAYFAISRSTRSNLSAADDFAITRAAINFSTQSLDKGMIAPILWYLIAGLPAVLIYACLSALSWRFGKSGASKGFGEAAMALEKLMGFLPNLITGVIIAIAGLFTPTAKPHKGILAFIGHKNRASYEQGGMPLSALAWSLNLSLGGARQDIDGTAIKSQWVGPEKATAQNDHKHLRRALYTNILSHILFIGILLGMYVWAGVLGGEELNHIKL